MNVNTIDIILLINVFLNIVSIKLSIKDIAILNNNIVIVDVEKIFLNVNNLNKISIDTT